MSSFIGNKGVAAVVLLLLSSNVSADACEVFDQAVLADNVDVSTWLSEAEKIVQAHGSNGRLSSEQFKGYQNQLKFREVDSNKDGKLPVRGIPQRVSLLHRRRVQLEAAKLVRQL